MALVPLPSLDSLRCFVEVAERLNFRAAAKAVALTPAAVSGRVRALEDQVGKPLFTRSTRSVALTTAGVALLPEARAALAAAERSLRVARGELGPPAIELTLGTRHELGMSWVLPSLPALGEALPHVTFHLAFGDGADLLGRVRAGTLACAIGSMRHPPASLTSAPLHEERYVLVAAPRLAARQPLRRPADALAHRVVDIDGSLPLLGYLHAAPGGAGLVFGSARFMGTIAAVRAVVLGGEGVAVLPEYLVREDLARRRLVRLLPRQPLLADWFRLSWRAGDERTALFTAVAEVLRQRPLR